ncbi:MAG: thermonuclease family protein [Cyanobacteria bacterium P01_D01_bin.156]
MKFSKRQGLLLLGLLAIAAIVARFDAIEGLQASIQAFDSGSGVPNSEHWLVMDVSDGDTLRVGLDGEIKKLRICGIDAPEISQPLGNESRAYLESLLALNQEGRIIVVPLEEDQYGRTVAELFLQPDNRPDEEISINAEMLMAGMAFVYPQYVSGCPSDEALKRAEAIGQEAKVGVWATEHQYPWDYRQENR